MKNYDSLDRSKLCKGPLSPDLKIVTPANGIRQVKAMFTLNRIAFAQQRKLHRIRLLFTRKNGRGGAISVTNRSCTAPIDL